jgi:hypothetical protein
MRKKIIAIVFVSAFISPMNIFAQKLKIYDVTTWEMIFSSSNVQFKDVFTTQYKNAEVTKTDVRYTVFFHLGEYWNFDFGNHIGIFTGMGIRNVGLITDERLPDYVGSDQLVDYKIIRRIYTAGVPLAFKLGSFSENLYLFAGGEYEFAINYKEKYWTGTQSRTGSKTKSNTWFGNQTPEFLPSVFAGVQLPGGINIKFKYYPDNFLNNNYTKGDNTVKGEPYNVSDLTRYKNSQVFYISLSWQIDNEDIKDNKWNHDSQFALN